MESAIDGIQKGFNASETTVICPWGDMVIPQKYKP
jgi:hypothetical protein